MKNKIVIFLLKISLFSLVFLYLMDVSGVVSITWKEWHVTTSLNIVLVGIASLVASVLTVRWIKNKIWSILHLSDAARLKDLRIGIEWIEKALIQDHLGFSEQKIDCLKRAQKFLPESNLPKLLLGKAQSDLSNLSSFKEKGALKTLSMLQHYRKNNDWEKLGKFFHKPLPNLLKEGWFWREAFFYWKGIQNWSEAKIALEKSLYHQGFSGEEAKKEKAILLYHLALEEEDAIKQLELFQQSYSIDPTNADNVVAYAKLLSAQHERRFAKKVLEKNWRHKPMPLIAQTYVTLFSANDSIISEVHVLRDLHDLMPNEDTSRICLIFSLLKAKLWAEAASLIDALEDHTRKTFLEILLEMKEKKLENVPLSSFKKFVRTIEPLSMNDEFFG